MFLDKNRRVLYVGKAKNLKKRVASYFTHKDLGEKTQRLVSQVHKIRTIPVSSEIESLLVETNLVKKYSPKYNVRLTDGKAYPLIRITVKDKYPKVLIARRPEDKNSEYFGPYPNVGAMRSVLKTIRRIFPFESVKNHPKKACLYYHLGLCPCTEVFGDGEYKKNIRRIIKFLKGQTRSVICDLEKEREGYSKKDEFEKARKVQSKINAIKLITSPVYNPFEYEVNPNLKSDIRQKELAQLTTVLRNAGVGINSLSRIECFDISNISGSSVTGSMVAFKEGEKDSDSYRRFRIKIQQKGKPNDFAAMEEIIKRRINHPEWPLPDLLVVDGGKGQVTSALNALKSKNLNLPVVGLAKREETIITESLKAITLPRSSPALHLMMRIRDEAHRFAITYHKKIRNKFLYS